MKTLIHTQTKVLSLDDIIFAGRNHDYGAYELRKKYHKYLFLSFLFTSGAFIFVVITSYLYNNHNGYGTSITTTVDATLAPPPPVDQPVVPPPPPPPVYIAAIVAFRVPNVVDTTNQEATLILMDDLDKTNTNGKLDTATSIIVGPRTIDVEPNEPPVINVTETATFDGGNINNFRKWVVDNLKYTEEMKSMHLDGRLVIQFVINKNGSIDNVKVFRSIDPLMDNEAIRVIKTSPKWNPGKLNGRIIRQQFELPIVFRIQDQ